MPFWRKETPEEVRQREAQERTTKALESGDIPPIAKERIQREIALGNKFFSSDLSCREYLLLKQGGFQTLGQVMGTAFFQVRWNSSVNWNWGTVTRELTDLTEVQTNSRKLAIKRLKKEAELMGASGVVGVRLTSRVHGWAGGLTEFTAIGTAIRIPGWPAGRTFTSSLNGQEFWQLYEAGYHPVDMVMGVCSYFIFTDQKTRSLLYTWLGTNNANNQEIVPYTQGFYHAREWAQNRLMHSISSVGADGVIGVDFDPDVQTIAIESSNTTYHHLLCNFVITGTAIKQAAPAVSPRKPLMCLDLAKRTWGKLGSTGDWDEDTVIAPDTRISNAEELE